MITLTFLLVIAAAALTFVSGVIACIVAYLALLAAAAGPGVGAWTLVFWAVAVVIVAALYRMLPAGVAKSRVGVPYMAGGAVTGALLGMLISHPAMLIGTILGAVAGGVAYGRTPSGHALAFPSRKFFNYLCAKAFPIVIAISIAAAALAAVTGYA